MARPGGNITGFSSNDTPMAGKWLQMLTQITPPVERVAVLYNPATAPYAGLYLRAIEAAAASLAVAVRAVPVNDDGEIEAMMAGLAHQERGGLVVVPDNFAYAHRDAIVARAARHHLPAVYASRDFVASGGLMSYAVDREDLFRRSAAYIDRLLKGAKRPAGPATDEIRDGDQPEDRQGARRYDRAIAPRRRRRGHRMRTRREFIAGAVSAATVSRAAAQQSAKRPRLAIFSPSEPIAQMYEGGDNRYYRALFEELRRRGYVEGQNLTVERYAREQNTDGPAATVAQVVRSTPDVVYVVGPGAQLFKRATATIPIVALTGDPIAADLVQSLARPGGNITGVSVDTGPAIYGKRVELLREVAPAISKLAYLTLRVAWENVQGAAMRAACEAVGIPLVSSLLEFPASEADYQGAIASAVREGANAIIVGENPDAVTHRALIAELIGQARLPAMYSFREFVEVGGLIAYTFDLVGLNQRVAADIDAILHGASPGDIPYFQSTKFELFINLKTAKALGLTVPPLLFAFATEVIE